MFLIDTDVLSALRRRDRHPELVRWLQAQRTADLYLSAVTVGEIERGIAQQQRRDPSFARELSCGWTECSPGTATGFSTSTSPLHAGGGVWPETLGTKGRT